jgi:signal peptidase I
MFFLTPRYLKHGRQFAKDARKVLAYKRDVWSAQQVEEFERGIAGLEAALRARDRDRAEVAARELDGLCTANLPPQPNAGWRENVEVFLVAIVVALGVRTYFLQPFTIPTGSMYPTLNGIIGHATPTPPPNPLVRVLHLAWFGRTWVNLKAKDDETIRSMTEVSRYLFATYTRLETDRNVYFVHIPIATATARPDEQNRTAFGLGIGQSFRAGETIIRGYHDTGDHVFVDKMTYHFRKPRREEVFVFNTAGIQTLENRTNRNAPSQFYIKRLAGVPDDELRIDPPRLFANGDIAKGEAFARVMGKLQGYGGYANGFSSFLMPILQSPGQTFRVPEDCYFALGDNSYHSSDSRDWGPVPQRNIVGRGVFVYWPFQPHFGGIR